MTVWVSGLPLYDLILLRTLLRCSTPEYNSRLQILVGYYSEVRCGIIKDETSIYGVLITGVEVEILVKVDILVYLRVMIYLTWPCKGSITITAGSIPCIPCLVAPSWSMEWKDRHGFSRKLLYRRMQIVSVAGRKHCTSFLPHSTLTKGNYTSPEKGDTPV